jgi:mono/diheme cytochrome c family protein
VKAVLNAFFVLSIIVLAILGCKGDEGPAGPTGSRGLDWPGVTPAAYDSADGIAGGVAYSKWWVTEAGGSGTQPATTASADFYRCKSCHGWDGLGNSGSYANRTGQSTGTATRPDVSWTNLRSAISSESYQELYDLVSHVGARGIDAADNAHPGFSRYLSNSQIWNIVKFMREEWVDPNLLYDITVTGPAMHWDYSVAPPVLVKPTVTYSNLGALGNESSGQTLYTSRCSSCHGADGSTLTIEGMSLGQFVRTKPNEAWFKAKFGVDGTAMNPGIVTSTSDLQNLYAALVDTANFPNHP